MMLQPYFSLWKRSNAQIAYTGTITGLRISAVDGGATASGGAFIDNAGATIPTFADGLHSIEIYDSAGRALKGVLKAAGVAEGLDSNLIINGTFTGWTGNTPNSFTKDAADTGTDYSIEDAGKCKYVVDTYVGLTQVEGGGCFVLNKLYKVGVNITSNTGLTLSINEYGVGKFVDFTGTGVKSTYHTGIYAQAGINPRVNAGVGNLTIDDLAVEQVLAPSTSGSVIVSLKAGTVYNFSYKHASFAFNEASYLCVVRAIR